MRHLMMVAMVLAVTAQALAVDSPPTRIKDIAVVAGTTGERVMGYGLVIGLEGTGDSSKSGFTAQALANMLEHFDLKVTAAQLTTQNVAAVIVTATLPPAGRTGDKLDVTVASVGDAESLYGGILLPTPLKGNDDEVSALAQGAVSIGGMNASSGGQKVQRNHPVTARLVGGGTLLKPVAGTLATDTIPLTLLQPDFTTARRVAEAINKRFGEDCATALGAESVEVKVPEGKGNVVNLIAEIEALSVVSDTAARVVVNERTGTIIIGGDVHILPVAVAQGSLTVTVTRRAEVSQPPPLFVGGAATAAEGSAPADPPETAAKPRSPAVAGVAGGKTVVTTRTDLSATEEPASLMQIEPQTRLSDLVAALNALGVKPRDLIAVLQALRAANALQAELVLM